MCNCSICMSILKPKTHGCILFWCATDSLSIYSPWAACFSWKDVGEATGACVRLGLKILSELTPSQPLGLMFFFKRCRWTRGGSLLYWHCIDIEVFWDLNILKRCTCIKLNWNSQRGGVRSWKNPSHGGGMDVFWNIVKWANEIQHDAESNCQR